MKNYLILSVLLTCVGLSKEPNYYINEEAASEGKIKGESTYKNGKENGKWVGYYPNGQKFIEGTYKDGKEVGKWTVYNEDGTINKVIEY